mmetsp:Transcript_35159/g.59228  ORF Transcript_35159/g.59228 Transcript_35159/m.59228 type:complete len:469 (-) Transcript_35159:371-1777(-)
MSTASSEETTGPPSLKVGDPVTKKGKQARRGKVEAVKVDKDGKDSIKVWWYDQEAVSACWLVASCYLITTLDDRGESTAAEPSSPDPEESSTAKGRQATADVSTNENMPQKQSSSSKGGAGKSSTASTPVSTPSSKNDKGAPPHDKDTAFQGKTKTKGQTKQAESSPLTRKALDFDDHANQDTHNKTHALVAQCAEQKEQKEKLEVENRALRADLAKAGERYREAEAQNKTKVAQLEAAAQKAEAQKKQLEGKIADLQRRLDEKQPEEPAQAEQQMTPSASPSGPSGIPPDFEGRVEKLVEMETDEKGTTTYYWNKKGTKKEQKDTIGTKEQWEQLKAQWEVKHPKMKKDNHPTETMPSRTKAIQKFRDDKKGMEIEWSKLGQTKLLAIWAEMGLTKSGQMPDDIRESYRLDMFGNVISNKDCHPRSLCAFEIDHVFPWARGGCTVKENLVPIYWGANSSKSDDILQV